MRDKRPKVQLRAMIKDLGAIYEGAAAPGPTFEMGQTTEVYKFIIQSRKAMFEGFLI